MKSRQTRTGDRRTAGAIAVAAFPALAALAPLVAVVAGLSLTLSACATLAPQQRAILADPTMQFDAEAKHDAALRHAIDNREGSMGGTGVSGGGCGCN